MSGLEDLVRTGSDGGSLRLMVGRLLIRLRCNALQPYAQCPTQVQRQTRGVYQAVERPFCIPNSH